MSEWRDDLRRGVMIRRWALWLTAVFWAIVIAGAWFMLMPARGQVMSCPPDRPHRLVLDGFKTCDLVGHWPGRRCRPVVAEICLSDDDMERARK